MVEVVDRAEGGRVLVVDDDDSVRGITVRILTRFGFGVLDASSGEVGVEILRVQRKLISAVVLDWSMPGLSGAQTFCAMRQLVEDMSIIVLTGWSPSICDELPDEMLPIPILQKPYDPIELVALVRDAELQR